MKKTTLFVTVLCFMCVVIASGCFARDDSLSGQSVKPRFNRVVAIKEYFENKDLASIEGIWVWETIIDKYEGAIVSLDKLPKTKARNIRKNYGHGIQYACFLTEAAEGLEPGALKMVIKEPIGGIYKGYYISYKKDDNWYGFKDGYEIPIKLSILSKDTLVMEATYRNGDRVTNEARRIYPTIKSWMNDSSNMGVGFFVAKDVIATCYSNIAEADEIRVHFKNGLFKGKLLSRDKTNDLALVKLEETGGLSIHSNALPIGDVGSVSKGDRVFAPMYTYLLGSPDSKIKEGRILGLTGEKNDPRVFETDISIDEINSGAPILNDSMQVVGILTYLPSNSYFKVNSLIPEGVSYAIKINNLFNLAASSRECPKLRIGASNPRVNEITVFDSVVMVEGIISSSKRKSLYEIMKE